MLIIIGSIVFFLFLFSTQTYYLFILLSDSKKSIDTRVNLRKFFGITDTMPSLSFKDRENCLGPCRIKCNSCKKIICKDYCRQCDEFYYICSCKSSVQSMHFNHRNYYNETILYAVKSFIKNDGDLVKVNLAYKLLQELNDCLTPDKERYILLKIEALIWENQRVKTMVLNNQWLDSGSWRDYIGDK